ncbi:protein NLRC3-like [Engraulis encrasicolus]|uniref:protein NLRC3-like n=1 Tax=Engraulis encrasicolus TaxID=184585 RepID=UPI002FD0BEC0
MDLIEIKDHKSTVRHIIHLLHNLFIGFHKSTFFCFFLFLSLFRKCFLPDTVPRTSRRSCNDNYRTIFTQHKDYLKKQVENIRERVLNPDSQKPHGSIDTTLYITEGEYKAVDVEHGVAQVEVRGSEDTQINYNDIFNPLPGQNGPIRAVLTKGAPGIGKTVLVQRFISDWADGKANQDIDVVILLPLRLLNRIKREISLQQLLSQLYPSLQEWVNSVKLEDYQILFIFFALDECNLPLNFEQNRKLSDISQKASVDTLVTSLIMGSLVPNARIWITSRHVASDQIPPEVIDKVTEVRGFTDVQKEEYFKRHISDEGLAERIISHIKASRSIQAMCRLPVFCWIAATVLQQMEFSDEIPTTLTEMFIHFLLIQTTSRHKYQGDNKSAKQDTLEAQKHNILKLAELAFKQLNEGNLMFSHNDLKQCGLDKTEALVYSGLCTATLKGQAAIFGEMYTFVQITIQEFLAALYIFVSYVKEDTEALRPLLMKKSSMQKIPRKHPSLEELLRCAVNSALESKSGHLDLFVRFLHGMAMESNQKVLRVLLACQQDNPRYISNPDCLKRAAQNLKDIKRKDISPDRWINLLYCLVEIHDTTVHQEVQAFMHSETGALKRLKPAHCSALASTLMMAAMPMDEFDLKKYKTSDEGRRRLVPAVRSCKKALLADCRLTAKSCEIVASALKAPRSLLRELDMSHNNMQDSGVKHLSSGLRNSNCKLETLRLSACGITGKGCELLASALTANPAHLKELDLSSNHLKEAQLRTLQSIKENPESALEILR